ncbi:MAG: Smr/MutS family protein, partial [Burkholderiaceae bacterium]
MSHPRFVAHALQDLGPLRARLAQERARAEAEERARRAAAAQARAAQQEFARAVGPVTPLRAQGTVLLRPEPPAPLALQHQRDEQRVLQEALSDDFDVGSLLDTDETLSFRRPGIAPEVSRRLRQGAWTLQAELDLHGLRTDEARAALGQFLRTALQRGLRCVRIVHGKGLGSPGKSPVLKGRVHSWLVQKDEVLAFVQARADEGGAGALVVLLRAQRQRTRNGTANFG